MKTSSLDFFRNQKKFSITKVAGDILSDTPTFQNLSSAHNDMMKGIKVVGLGLFGLFAFRQLTK